MAVNQCKAVRLIILKSDGFMTIQAVKHPNWRFAVAHPAHFLALGCGSGLSKYLPGTLGTLFGWAVYIIINPVMSNLSWFLLIALSFVLGIKLCDITGKALGVADHGAIVWDEMVAIWLVLWIAADRLEFPFGELLCVAVFRFFDMVKPPPISWFDRRFKNGLGVMLDDLIAAFISLFVLAIGLRLL